MRTSLSVLGAWTGLLLSVTGQDEPALVSGPPPGSSLKAIPCYAERGLRAGQEFDAAREAADSPAAFLFIHDLSRNTAPVIREFDRLGREHSLLGFEWFTILLQGDRTEGENMLKRVNGSLRLQRPIALSLSGLEGPGDYALNRRCTLTLVLAKAGEVTESIALTDTGPGDFPRLKQWIESVAGALPEDEEALRALLMDRLPREEEALRRLAVDQMLEIRQLRQSLAQAASGGRGNANRMRPQANRQRPPQAKPESDAADASDAAADAESASGRKREGKPPEDSELNQSLRAFIRKTNDDTRSAEVFQQITARAAESEALTAEAVEMFKLMLSFPDNYGTEHAQGLAKSFLQAHAKNPKEE